jgi:hypothetical protein
MGAAWAIWLCFHGVEPPRFPFGSHVILIFMPSGLGSASQDASACSTSSCGWWGCGSFGDVVAECT